MKSTLLCATTILLSVSLISCRQHADKQDDTLPPHITRGVKANNIIYLHDIVTRVQDTEATFNNLIASGNVVVDFYADWCNPCRMMGRVIDQLASQFPSITFLKVDTDKFKTVGRDVQSIPTLIFYKNGTQLTRVTGAKDKNKFTELLTKWYQDAVK